MRAAASPHTGQKNRRKWPKRGKCLPGGGEQGGYHLIITLPPGSPGGGWKELRPQGLVSEAGVGVGVTSVPLGFRSKYQTDDNGLTQEPPLPPARGSCSDPTVGQTGCAFLHSWIHPFNQSSLHSPIHSPDPLIYPSTHSALPASELPICSSLCPPSSFPPHLLTCPLGPSLDITFSRKPL